LKRETKERREIERKMGDGSSSIKVKHSRDTIVTVITISSLTKRACSNKGSRKDEYNCGKPK